MSMNFDPMTGEPIENNQEEINFDPMTGQPIGQSKEEMNFDPMSGKPITGQPVSGGNTTKSSKTNKIILVVAAVAAVAVIAFAGIVSGAFLGKGNKVLLAISNTLEDESHLAEALTKMSDILSSGEYTVAVSGEVEGVEANVEFMDATSKKQIKGVVDAGTIEVDFDGYMDKDQVAVQIPAFTDKVLTYNAQGKNDGYLMEQLDGDAIESINELLETACSAKEQEKLADDISAAILKEYKNLKFETADKKEFEVDGKDRKCKGYETTVTADHVLNILDALEEVIADEYSDALEMAEVDINDAFSDARKDFRDMPDAEVVFYLYKNKLAAIVVEMSGADVEIAFLGGDTRTQNMEVEVEGRSVLEVKGETEGGVERTRVYTMNAEICELKYDYKEGDFTLDIVSELYLDGKLQKKNNSVAFALDEMEVDGETYNLDVECSVKKGAKVQKVKGDVFDIGTASEEDFQDLAKEISDMYSDMY